MSRRPVLAALALVTVGLVGCAPSRPAATANARLSDGELLGIFVSLYQSVLLTSQPTADADDPDLRGYAQRMVESHQAVLVDSEAGIGGIRPVASPVSRAIDQTARGNATRLGQLRGEALDSAYVRTQVALHRQTLDWLDFVLLPQASPSLRPAFQEARPMAERHLEEIWALHNLRLLAE